MVAALALPNGPSLAIDFLAVSATAACAPLNPRLGPDDAVQQLRALRPAGLVVDGRACPQILSAARQIDVRVFEDRPFEGGRPVSADTRLVLTTSGTTAAPKLVPLTASNLSYSARSIAARLGLSPESACLNVMPLFHIHGLVAALLASLTAGGRVLCAPGFDAELIPGWVAQQRLTWMTCVPTMLHAFARLGGRSAASGWAGSLSFLRSSSAPLPVTLQERLESLYEIPVIQAYGMTEASHEMASNPLPPGMRKPNSVGLPTGAEIRVVDERGADAERGEVVVRGPGLMADYLDASPRPFHADGWFQTGDLGQFDRDGYLTLAGRSKELINRGGEKISPLEVEAILLEQAGVEAAAVFGLPHPTLGEEVAAAVVLALSAPRDQSTLINALRDRIAPSKVPRKLMFVERLPTGPTGKVERTRLPRQLGLI